MSYLTTDAVHRTHRAEDAAGGATVNRGRTKTNRFVERKKEKTPCQQRFENATPRNPAQIIQIYRATFKQE